jgi:hypothetical protein
MLNIVSIFFFTNGRVLRKTILSVPRKVPEDGAVKTFIDKFDRTKTASQTLSFLQKHLVSHFYFKSNL